MRITLSTTQKMRTRNFSTHELRIFCHNVSDTDLDCDLAQGEAGAALRDAKLLQRQHDHLSGGRVLVHQEVLVLLVRAVDLERVLGKVGGELPRVC